MYAVATVLEWFLAWLTLASSAHGRHLTLQNEQAARYITQHVYLLTSWDTSAQLWYERAIYKV